MNTDRAFIIALAYFIGFTTAFIGYGISSSDSFPLSQIQTANVISSVNQAPSNNTATPLKEVVVRKDVDLTMTKGAETRLISAAYKNAANLGERAHTALTGVALSQDNNFLVYCAATLTSGDNCDLYIYDWSYNTIHPVVFPDNQNRLKQNEVHTLWTNKGLLSVNDHISKNANEPWLLK